MNAVWQDFQRFRGDLLKKFHLLCDLSEEVMLALQIVEETQDAKMTFKDHEAQPDMGVNVFNPSTQLGVKAGRCLRVQGQHGLYSDLRTARAIVRACHK